MQKVEVFRIPTASPDDVSGLKNLIENHFKYTQSRLAKKMLDNWSEYVDRFIKVVPIEYKKVLQEEKMEAINKKIAQVERDY